MIVHWPRLPRVVQLIGSLAVAGSIGSSCAGAGLPTLPVTLTRSGSEAASVMASPSPSRSGSATTDAGMTWCRVTSLELVGVRNGESGVVNAGVTITDRGPKSCWLPNLPATVALVPQDGTTLRLSVIPPLATPGPPLALHVEGPAATLIFYWTNWCEAAPGPLAVQVTFDHILGVASGPLDGPVVP